MYLVDTHSPWARSNRALSSYDSSFCQALRILCSKRDKGILSSVDLRGKGKRASEMNIYFWMFFVCFPWRTLCTDRLLRSRKRIWTGLVLSLTFLSVVPPGHWRRNLPVSLSAFWLMAFASARYPVVKYCCL